MTFSKARYQAIVSNVEQQNIQLPPRLNQVIEEAKLLNYGAGIFGGVAGYFVNETGVANEIARLGTELCQRVGAFLEDLVVVPFAMWDAGNAWLNVESTAGSVASDLEEQLLTYGPEWQGLAGGAYYAGAQLQPEAAGQISSLAQTASAACLQVAQIGEAFGAAILLNMQHVGDSIASLDPATVAGALSEAITGIAQAYAQFELGVKAQGKGLKPLLIDYYELPGGNWPIAVTSS